MVRNSVVRRKRKYSISGSAMNQAENNESVMRRHIRYGLYDRMTTYIYQHNLTTQSHLLDRKSDLRHGLGWYCLEGGQNYTKQVNPNATEFKSTDFWHRLNATRQIKCTSLRYIAFNLPTVAFTLSGDPFAGRIALNIIGVMRVEDRLVFKSENAGDVHPWSEAEGWGAGDGVSSVSRAGEELVSNNRVTTGERPRKEL